MTAGGRSLDDKAVHAPAAAREAHRQRLGRDDREGSVGRRSGASASVFMRSQGWNVGVKSSSGAAPGDVERQDRRLVADKPIEQCGDLTRNTCAHEHVVHPGEQRAVQDRRLQAG